MLYECINNGAKHVGHGDFRLAYFAMPNYGYNLLDFLKFNDGMLAYESIFHLGIKLLDILELMHESGLVYHELKPENIMVDWDKN